MEEKVPQVEEEHWKLQEGCARNHGKEWNDKTCKLFAWAYQVFMLFFQSKVSFHEESRARE